MTITICSSVNEAKIINGFPYFAERTAIINIRPYLTERLEYQYPEEPKQTIYSTGGKLNYELKEIYPEGTKFVVFGTYISKRLRFCNQQQLFRSNGSVRSPYFVSSVPNRFNELFVEGSDGVRRLLVRITQSQYDSKYLGLFSGRHITYRSPNNNCPNINKSYGHSPIEKFSVPENNNTQSQCQFTVTETRHQETRDVCPTVQQFEAELGDIQIVAKELKKNEILLVSTGQDTNHSILNYFGDKFNNYLQNNPSHCLVIWGVKDNNNTPFKVAQICSSKGSLPPKIVSIECEKEKCPNNTCEVICNSHICCYNNQGIPVKIINK